MSLRKTKLAVAAASVVVTAFVSTGTAKGLPFVAQADSVKQPIAASGLQKAVRVSVGRSVGSHTGAWTPDAVLARPFGDSSPWNSQIGPGASYTPTSTFAGDAGWINTDQSSFPVYFGGGGDPVLTFVTGTGTYQLHAPAGLVPAGGSDANATVVDLTNDTVTDFWILTRTGPTTFAAAGGVQTSLDGTGFGTLTAKGKVRAGTRASGSSGLGGMITGANLSAGRIDHALAIAASGADMVAQFVAPAVTMDSDAASSYSGTLPMGTRLAIPPGTPKPALSPIGSMVWDAFVRYGGYVVDRTGGFAIFGEPNTVSPGAVAGLVRGSSDLRQIVPALQVVR
jgi:hypothetical protein